MNWRFALILTGMLFLGCARQPGGPDSSMLLPAGDYEFAVAHEGRSRFYLLHVPADAGSGRLALVVAMHGGGGNPEDFKAEAAIDDVADREKFLVAYPAGSGLLPRTLLTWNAGTHCCGFALDRDLDDVGFIREVVADVSRRTAVDPERVYATGHSNGAMMAYRVGVEAAHLFAAIAPVAGAMMVAEFQPARAVPVLHIHSVDDPRALYDGGLGPAFPLGGEQVLHRPVDAGLELWRARNECAPEPEAMAQRSGAPGSLNDGHRAVKLVWNECASGAPVVHWRLEGVGHGWPGTLLPPQRENLAGPSTTLISAAEEVWDFLKDHRLP